MEDWRRKYPCPIWHMDFLGSEYVTTASNEEVGIFTLLLFWQWEKTGCKLPDDPRYLAEITRCRTAKQKGCLKGVLTGGFQSENGHVWNENMHDEYLDKLSRHEKAIADGKKGGRPLTADD